MYGAENNEDEEVEDEEGSNADNSQEVDDGDVYPEDEDENPELDD